MSGSNVRTVKVLAPFIDNLARLTKRYRRVREDIQPLIEQLRNGETPGDQVKGTGHVVYKARVANRDARRGKSGGYRVVYAIDSDTIALLVIIYSKTDQDDILPSVLKEILDRNP